MPDMKCDPIFKEEFSESELEEEKFLKLKLNEIQESLVELKKQENALIDKEKYNA